MHSLNKSLPTPRLPSLALVAATVFVMVLGAFGASGFGRLRRCAIRSGGRCHCLTRSTSRRDHDLVECRLADTE